MIKRFFWPRFGPLSPVHWRFRAACASAEDQKTVWGTVFPDAGDDCDLGGFSGLAECCVFGLEVGVEAHGDQGGHPSLPYAESSYLNRAAGPGQGHCWQ